MVSQGLMGAVERLTFNRAGGNEEGEIKDTINNKHSTISITGVNVTQHKSE